MNNDQNTPTLAQRAITKGADIAISEAKSAAAWYAIGNIGKVIALVAAFGGGAMVMTGNHNNALYGGTVANTANKAGAGEWACLTPNGLITAYKPKYLKGCTTSPKFMLFK